MLSKRRRIPVQRFIAQNKPSMTASSSYFSLRARSNDMDINRFGAVIGKKVHKNTTVRNTLKRRALAHANGWKDTGLDIIIYILPPALKLTRGDFYRELDQVKEKLYQRLS